MKREILFKAQRADGEGWIFGNYCSRVNGYEINEHCIQVVVKNDEGIIISISTYEVLPETVCQYTGLKDKNGVKIFEGDVLRGGVYNKYHVVWDNETAGFELNEYYVRKVFEVTGNIHD